MRKTIVGSLIVLCLCIAGVVRADRDDQDRDDQDHDDSDAQVVTNTPPAARATMTLQTNENGCSVWTVQGKVRKVFRGRGAKAKLLCMPFNELGNGGTGTVFPPDECDSEVCPGDVDSAGNFTFQIRPSCEGSPQLGPTNFCVFIVHVDEKSDAPNSSTVGNPNSPPGGDPNGSAPCTGGYCPDI